MWKRLFGFGLASTLVTALCCFTPLLPTVLAFFGLTGLITVLYNDAVLLPLLAASVALTGYAFWKQKAARQ